MVDSCLKKRFSRGGIKERFADMLVINSHAAAAGAFSGGKKKGSLSLFKLLNEKKEFLIAVFANLITQLSISYFVMMNYLKKEEDEKSKERKKRESGSLYWGLIFATFIIVVILSMVSMPSWMKFILFCIFSVCWGILLSFMKLTVDSTLIQTAILGTLAIFGVMFLVGAFLLVFGVALGYMAFSFLFFSLLLLILGLVVTSLMGTYSYFEKMLAVIGLILFSLYIVYDTNTILQRNYYGDFITASLDYYLDILNIFLDLITLQNR